MVTRWNNNNLHYVRAADASETPAAAFKVQLKSFSWEDETTRIPFTDVIKQYSSAPTDHSVHCIVRVAHIPVNVDQTADFSKVACVAFCPQFVSYLDNNECCKCCKCCKCCICLPSSAGRTTTLYFLIAVRYNEITCRSLGMITKVTRWCDYTFNNSPGSRLLQQPLSGWM